MKLTPKQERFCNEYLVDLNATQAAIRAGYKPNYADRMAHKLVENSRVQEYLQKRMKARERRTEITQDRVLQELANIGFSNGSDFAKVIQKSYMKNDVEIFYNTVEMVLTDDLDKNKLPAIAGIKTTKDGIEVKMNDKVKALELMGKHLGMFTEKVELSGETKQDIKINFNIPRPKNE